MQNKIEASSGTFSCPICGKDTPHHHSQDEIDLHSETERWVNESWERDRPKFFRNSTP